MAGLTTRSGTRKRSPQATFNKTDDGRWEVFVVGLEPSIGHMYPVFRDSWVYLVDMPSFALHPALLRAIARKLEQLNGK